MQKLIVDEHRGLFMYKVLLVDDEIYVRKGLIGLMDWNALQYEICGEAENGQQALEMIEELEPDLVIADIRMPVLDGLGLIKEVNENSIHQPLFIIVSGYHDFAYAQQALRYHVSDYILKPVDESELEMTLRKIAGTLSKRRLTTLTGEKSINESVMETLLNTECSDRDAEQLATALHISANGPYSYAVLETYTCTQEEVDSTVIFSELQHLLSRLMDKINFHIPAHIIAPTQYGMLIHTEKLKQAMLTSTEQEAFRLLQQLIVRELKQQTTLFVGLEVKHLKEVSISAKRVKDTMNYRYAEDGKAIILASEVLGTPLYYFDIEASLYNNLILHIEENQHKEYIDSVSQIIQHFKQKRFAPSAVANAITRCTIGIINIVKQMDGNEDELEQLPHMFNWQKKNARLHDIQQLFESFVQESAQYIAERRGSQGKGSIEKIKKYIDTHYTENINLKSIASKFYMNSVYLGQLFRKTYGVYFNEYLLTIRVEEAKKMLRQTDMRMYEIAEKVGFQNADYFVTQFEKIEKLTPTDYRNKLIGKK